MSMSVQAVIDKYQKLIAHYGDEEHKFTMEMLQTSNRFTVITLHQRSLAAKQKRQLLEQLVADLRDAGAR
jgi:hypothetical protein